MTTRRHQQKHRHNFGLILPLTIRFSLWTRGRVCSCEQNQYLRFPKAQFSTSLGRAYASLERKVPGLTQLIPTILWCDAGNLFINGLINMCARFGPALLSSTQPRCDASVPQTAVLLYQDIFEKNLQWGQTKCPTGFWRCWRKPLAIDPM